MVIFVYEGRTSSSLVLLRTFRQRGYKHESFSSCLHCRRRLLVMLFAHVSLLQSLATTRQRGERAALRLNTAWCDEGLYAKTTRRNNVSGRRTRRTFCRRSSLCMRCLNESA